MNYQTMKIGCVWKTPFCKSGHLCNQQSAEKLLMTINSLNSGEAAFVHKCCNWSKAKIWAEWWLRPKRLQMLHKDFSIMDPSVRSRSPSTTNAGECLPEC